MASDAVIRKLSTIEIDAELATLPGWRHDPERRALFRQVELRDFAEAFGVMAQIAVTAERYDHHPEWTNVYNRIDIWLTTHDAGGVSSRDVDFARTIENFFS